jgi:hypothetical protein
MAKRITPEERVIAYFMAEPIVLAEQMFQTVRAIMRQRTPQPPLESAQRRKRSRAPKPAQPKPEQAQPSPVELAS